MTTGMQSDSVHRAIQRALTGFFDRIFLDRDSRVLAQTLRQDDPYDDPTDAVNYINWVIIGWALLSLGLGFVMVAAAYSADRLSGAKARDIALATLLGSVFFCLTGVFYSTFKLWLAHAANRRYRHQGAASGTYRRTIDRARLHNASLIVQALVGFATAAVALQAS
jgi:hypothetical protein